MRELRYLPIDEVPPADENPKDHDIPGVVRSLTEFGFIDPPAIDGRTGKLIAGHGRIEALQWMRDEGLPAPEGIDALGDAWKVPVVLGWESATDEEAIAAGIALNRYVERGGWLPAVLARQLQIIEASPIAIETVGYSHNELTDMLARLAPPTLAELEERYGDDDERGMWPVLRFQVSPSTRDTFRQLTADWGDDEDAVMARLLHALETGGAPE